ncbi:MAG: type II toxin-antitoxin system RelE/ParE family toxin [Sphingomonadaceae bacterium]
MASAAADLASIRDYTEREWGGDQAVRYLTKLQQSTHRLLDAPYLGSPYGGRRVSLRSLKSSRHRLIYDVSDEAIILVRVLHVRMDLHRHLP